MEIEVITKQMNKLTANFKITPYNNGPTRQELILGKVGIYFRLMPFEGWFYILVLPVKLHKNDDSLYACKISSEQLEITNKRYICEESEWRLMYENNDHNEFEIKTFDLSVEVETIFPRSPFEVLYDDEELADFELRAEDGSVRFHSAVLATASPALRRMLAGQWTETKDRSLQVQNASRKTLQHLKDYLYKNVLPGNDVEQLLLLASYYLMTELEDRCIDKLLNDLTAETSTELVKFALMHDLKKLYYAFLKLVQDGAIDVKGMQQSNA